MKIKAWHAGHKNRKISEQSGVNLLIQNKTHSITALGERNKAKHYISGITSVSRKRIQLIASALKN
jgi:hypothetical protein